MKSLRFIKLLTFTRIISTIATVSLQAQTYINKEWVKNYGSPDSMSWSASTIDIWDNIITVASTYDQTEHSNILITRFDEY